MEQLSEQIFQQLMVLMVLIVHSFAIIGVHNLFEDKHIFGKIGDWMESNLPLWISKPLFLCPPCMASIWGLPMAYLIYIEQPMPYLWMAIYVLALSGINKLITSLINL